MKTVFALLCVLSLGICAHAQTPANNNHEPFSATLPGRAYLSGGNTSPTDPHNFKYGFGADQGINLGVWRLKHGPIKNVFLAPHGGFWVRKDTEGRFYNNTEGVYAGLRLVGTFKDGAITLDLKRVHEHRPKSDFSKSGFTYGVDAYRLIRQPSDDKRAKKLYVPFSLSVSGYFGHFSVVEDDFYYGAGAKLGFLGTKMGPVYGTLFGEVGFDKDRKGYDWNNTRTLGIGFEFDIPKSAFISKVGCEYQFEQRTISGLSATGFTCSIKKVFRWYPKIHF